MQKELEVTSQEFNFRDLMNLAYNVAKKEFKDNVFSFRELWSVVWNKVPNSKNENVEDWIGAFYTDLIQDKRFLVCGPTSWRLREYITTEEAEKIANTMYLYEKDEIYEEGFENYQEPIKVESDQAISDNDEDEFNWNETEDEEETVNDIVQDE